MSGDPALSATIGRMKSDVLASGVNVSIVHFGPSGNTSAPLAF